MVHVLPTRTRKQRNFSSWIQLSSAFLGGMVIMSVWSNSTNLSSMMDMKDVDTPTPDMPTPDTPTPDTRTKIMTLQTMRTPQRETDAMIAEQVQIFS